jgi:hypothetical protein
MSMDIEDAWIKHYGADVHEAYQRMGSKLRNTVRVRGPIEGKSTTFQKVGKGAASTKTRHGKVPVMNIDHTPVEVTLGDYYAGDWVDELDQVKTNIDERSVQVNAGAYALGRKTDDLIIAALDSATTHQDSANLSALTPTAGAGYLTDLVTTMGARDVPVGDGQMFGVVSWQVWNKMLSMEEFKNADYIGADDLPFKTRATSARRWLDCIWMPHSGLTIASNVRTNFLYHRTAIGHAIGSEIRADITWHGDHASWFVNHMMSQGAGLIDTDGVQQLLITENA